MRLTILRNFERKLAQSAALLLIGGFAAGCSSDVTRFQDGILTGSTDSGNRAVASAPADQPYPGDSYQTSSLDTTANGSANRAVRPDSSVGGGTYAAQNTLPPPSAPAQTAAAAPASDIQRQPIAPTDASQGGSTLAAASPRLDTAPTGTASQPQQASASSGSGTRITVASGDTLYGLSRRHGVPVGAIMAANDMRDASALRAGQTLFIPSAAGGTRIASAAPSAPQAPADKTPQQEPTDRVAVLPQTPKTRENADTTASTTAPTAGGTYTVASGDTLYGISKKTGASVDRIKAANGLSNGYLQIGQKLTIPAAGETVVASAPKVDKVVTNTAGETKPPVTAYTPPEKSGTVAEEAGTQVASLPPDSTGIGRLRWPVRGMVVSKFGSDSGSANNDGIDIAVPQGTPVKAAENGVVIYAGDGLKEFGNTVLVRHEDGLVTVYGHADQIKVKRGDSVKRGQEIASSGMSGNADRPKLHFEVRKNSAPVDPSTYLE